MNKSILDDEIRYRLLKLVGQKPNLSQRALAQELGVSVGKLNYCLKALIDIGLIKVGNFTRSSHKLGYAYLLTPKGLTEKSMVTLRFLERKETEFEEMRKEIGTLREEARVLEDD